MKRLNIILVCLVLVSQITAQKSLDILTLSGRYTQPQDYDSLLSGKAQEIGGMVALTAPIPISNKTIIYNNLSYFYFQVDNETSLSDDLANPIKINGFILRTGIVQRLSQGRSIQLLLSPRYMSDLQGSGMDNMQFGGIAMFENEFNENLKMGFGALYNQEFFGPYFVPLVNLNWFISDRFSISGLLPIYAKINYLATSKLEVGISHFGLITTYRLNDPAYAGNYIERQSIDLSFFGRYNLRDNFYLEARIGHTLGRSYKQFSSDQKVDFAIPLVTFGDNRVAKNIQFKNSPLFSLRLIYNIPIPEAEDQ